MISRFKKERTIGKADGKRRYDLPLNKGAGTGFLTLLIALMTFLAVLAMAASFALSAMTDRWSSGLENRMTVEIPATDIDGTLMTHEETRSLTARVAHLLESHPAVAGVHMLSDQEIAELVKPWLGTDLLVHKIPVPGLIAVSLNDAQDDTHDILLQTLRTVAPQGRLDTHEGWLKDLLRFTGSLQLAALFLTVVIGLTTATAVAGAVRARMAIHAEEVQLLHLMGAADTYIARQFQRHSLILALQGAGAGLAAGVLALLLIGWVSGEMEVSLLPDFSLSLWQITGLLTLPFVAAMIAMIAAGHTVYNVLSKMA